MLLLLLLLQFVAHPNCQQHLTSIWYGQQMGFMQSLTLWKQLGFWLVCIVLLPVICLVYIVAPHTQVGYDDVSQTQTNKRLIRHVERHFRDGYFQSISFTGRPTDCKTYYNGLPYSIE